MDLLGCLHLLALRYYCACCQGDEDTHAGNCEHEDYWTEVVETLEIWKRTAADDKGSTGRLGKRTKQISTHTSNITYIIPHIIRNSSRILRTIFWQILLNLANKIRPKIRSLRKYSATNPSKHGNGRSSKPIPSNRFEQYLIIFLTIWW